MAWPEEDHLTSLLEPSPRWRNSHCKIHRSTKIKSGSSALISKRILLTDSVPGIEQMIDWRTGKQKPETVATMRPLQALKEDPFGLPGFCVAYSMDKRKRWTITDRLRSEIASFQDASIGRRISALEQSCSHESRDKGSIMDLNRAHSYHTVTIDGDEIHRTGKQGSYTNYTKPPNKPRTRGGKKRKDERRLAAETIERPIEAVEVDQWKRPVHIMYDVVKLELNKRKINNGQGTRNPSRACRFKTCVHSDRRIDMKRDFARDLNAYERGPEEVEEVEFISIEPEDVVKLEKKEVLADYGKPQTFVRIRKPKRRQTAVLHSREESFEQWLKTNGEPITDDQQVVNEEEAFEVKASTPIVKIDPLPFIDLDFGSEEMTAAFLTSRCPEDGHECGIWPSTACVHANVFETFNSGTTTAMRKKSDGSYRLYFNAGYDQKYVATIENGRHSSGTENGVYGSFQLPVKCLTDTKAMQEAAEDLLRSSTASGMSRTQQMPPDMVCSICFTEDEDGFALAECGHFACLECWLAMVAHSLSQNRVPIKCMCYDCDVVLKPESCHAFLPWSICRRYEKALALKRRMRNDWFECRKCNQWMHFENQQRKDLANPTVIVCDCGMAFCIRCQLPSHLPLTCQWNGKYEQMLKHNDVDSTSGETVLHSVNVKRCPQCSNLMERWYGCNHMTCGCGMQFCYICLSPWGSGNHYECKARDQHETILLVNVPRGLSYNLSIATFQRCMQHRNARSERTMQKIRRSLRVQYKIDRDTSLALETYQTAQKLLEYALVQIYYAWAIDRNRRINRLRSIYRRCEFLVGRFEQAMEMRQIDMLIQTAGKMSHVLRELLEVAILWL